MRRLLLIRHAPTSASDLHAFPLDEPLSDASHTLARGLRGKVPAGAVAVCSPSRRCLQTASALGLEPAIEPRIAECDFGTWSGRTLASIDAVEPEAVARWMTDPDAAPHGGESLAAFYRRIADWIDEMATRSSATTIAITHGGVIKAAVVHVRRAPLSEFWEVPAEPLSITELGYDSGSGLILRK